LALQPFSPVTFLLGVLVCNWLANLLHELGHLLAYKLLGLRWKRMVCSFFVFTAAEGFRFDKNRGLYEASCTCAYDSAVPAWRYMLALLGGGIFGILIGLAAVLLALSAKGSAAAFLLCFGFVNLLNSAANLLLPFSPDRALIKQIRNGREKIQ
jgi:hypothetical protein